MSHPPMPDRAPEALTEFQVRVTQIFFSLPEAGGFLLAGGAALLAQGLTDRPTQDLDFFTHPGGGEVPTARDALEAAASDRGWRVERIRDSPTFCRLLVRGPEDLIVDLAVDSPPGRPATASVLGPTYAPEELAGRKLLALFDRAAARDFVDVFVLADRYGKQALLKQALAIDAGFDHHVLSQAFATLGRYADADLQVPADQVQRLRDFFSQWQTELATNSPEA